LKENSKNMSKPKNPEKSREIQAVVARLFAHKGYDATSMREIARELGMNQSSLYHYFKSKEEILFNLANDAMDDALPTLEEICATDLSAVEKLKKVLDFYIHHYAGDQDRLTLLVNEMNSLDSGHRRKVVDKQRRYVDLIRSILDQLGREKGMRDVHPTVATFAFFGMVHYTIKWYDRQGPIDLDELARSFLEIFTRGVLVNG
jgi:TetR/AcrR family transcriptional regulator, cholesterol catabolism regulator